MKENEVPERIYCTPTEGGFYFTTIKPEPPFAEGVEYIQTKASIKKAVIWISNNCYIPHSTLENFKDYMKGE